MLHFSTTLPNSYLTQMLKLLFNKNWYLQRLESEILPGSTKTQCPYEELIYNVFFASCSCFVFLAFFFLFARFIDNRVSSHFWSSSTFISSDKKRWNRIRGKKQKVQRQKARKSRKEKAHCRLSLKLVQVQELKQFYNLMFQKLPHVLYF